MQVRAGGIGGLLPETLAQRGYSVPFTTNVLTHTRLRISEGIGLEALLPGLSGGRGTYVIPWADLPEVISMSLHDRSLFKGITKLPYFSPDRIRMAALEVQREGYDGPDRAEEAEQAIKKDHEVSLMTNFTLVSEAVRQVGDGVEYTPMDLINEENMKKARAAIRSYAEGLGLNVQDVMDILAEWAEITSAIGSPDGEHPGYLLRLLQDMARLNTELMAWADEEAPENFILAQQVTDAAEMCGRLAYEVMMELQQNASAMSRVLSNWARYKQEMINHVSRISGILDGWDRIVQRWDRVKEGLRHQQRDMISETVQNLPILPAEVLNKNQQIIWQKITEQQTKLLVDAGAVDFDDYDEVEGDIDQFMEEALPYGQA